MELPVYKCVIDPSLESDLQVEAIALVDRPAIEKNFLKFNEEKLRFSVDEEKRIVYGPAMIADMLIYRKSEEYGEYYTVFDAATIEAIVLKFSKKGLMQSFNLMHDEAEALSSVTIFESFIVNHDKGIVPTGFEDLKDGSWMIKAKVEDDAIWEKVKDGTYKGFSVEGIFRQVPVKMKMTEADILSRIKALLNSIEA